MHVPCTFHLSVLVLAIKSYNQIYIVFVSVFNNSLITFYVSIVDWLCLIEKKESEVTQSCPTLCDTMDCSLPGSSVHGIFQARVLEGVAISFSRGSSQLRDRARVSRTADRRLPPGKPKEGYKWTYLQNINSSGYRKPTYGHEAGRGKG